MSYMKNMRTALEETFVISDSALVDIIPANHDKVTSVSLILERNVLLEKMKLSF